MSCSGEDASRTLPTAENTPSRPYSSIEYRRQASIVDDGLNAVTRPAACDVAPGREARLLDQEDVRPARLGEVIGDAHPRDAAADDDDARLVSHALDDGVQASVGVDRLDHRRERLEGFHRAREVHELDLVEPGGAE